MRDGRELIGAPSLLLGQLRAHSVEELCRATSLGAVAAVRPLEVVVAQLDLEVGIRRRTHRFVLRSVEKPDAVAALPSFPTL